MRKSCHSSLFVLPHTSAITNSRRGVVRLKETRTHKNQKETIEKIWCKFEIVRDTWINSSGNLTKRDIWSYTAISLASESCLWYLEVSDFCSCLPWILGSSQFWPEKRITFPAASYSMLFTLQASNMFMHFRSNVNLAVLPYKMTWKCKLMGYYFERRCLASCTFFSCQLECQTTVLSKLTNSPVLHRHLDP